jgi:hypothetical protein
VPDQSHDDLIAIDPKRNSVLERHPIFGCQHPHGFIVAPAGAIGYIACDGNDRLITVELATGRLLANQPVAHDPDVLASDAQAHRLYVATESGNLSTFDIDDQRAPRALGSAFIAEGAHAVAVDPLSHHLFFDLANAGGQARLRILAPKND